MKISRESVVTIDNLKEIAKNINDIATALEENDSLECFRSVKATLSKTELAITKLDIKIQLELWDLGLAELYKIIQDLNKNIKDKNIYEI